jgi:hypothetical protein
MAGMNFDLDLGQWIVIALSAFLFIWYFAAISLNRKRSTAIFRWLRLALEAVGDISSAEWIGASNMGARATVKKALKPFRRVEVHYLLEPREFPPYWLYSRLRGKRDAVVINFTLRTAPKGSFEIQRKTSFQNPQTDPDESASTWMLVSGDKFQVTTGGQHGERLIEAVEAFLADRSTSIESISLQPKAPHLVFHARLVPLLHLSAETYFTPVQNWFQEG